QRVQLGEPLLIDDLDRDTDQLCHRRPLTELVEAIGARGQTDAPAGVVIHSLTRLRLQPLIELDGVAEQAHEVVARVELRAEAGCVPGRAARQLVLLEEDDVVPAEPRQVVRKAAAADAATDDCDPRLLAHLWNHLGYQPRRTDERDSAGPGDDLLR